MTKTVTATRKPRIAATAKSTKAVKAAASPGVFFALVEGARPVAGARLYAHTHAVLKFLGLLGGKSALRVAAEALMGKTAVDYHVSHENLALKDSKVKLTPRGVANFKARVESGRVDVDMADAFLAAFSTGAGNAAYRISAQHLTPIKNVAV